MIAGLPVVIWSSQGGDTFRARLPLLVVLDGPEHARNTGLFDLLDRSAAAGRLLSMRVALVAPRDRNKEYSASPAFAKRLVTGLLPALSTADGGVVGMGVSLGGLALLHAHRRFPTAFSGLFLQSGSFFTQATDGQESEFGGFRRIDRFVAEVRGRSRPWPHPVPMTMTCGADEENLANNEAMAEDLSRQGYDVMFDEFPGGHNWVTWRLALDAALVELIRRSLD